ncbi:hypothetical protein I7I51_05131 [Histoplasma capsulatum]|uniref:Uncharacterized protein n=1 Tax=Ajellomyces capsulatus TaxID=5037 RepID=A0A8A1M6F5_AJECA|nr:hypothetical protein I7I51_05131 [Histoplasma capsulatum]
MVPHPSSLISHPHPHATARSAEPARICPPSTPASDKKGGGNDKQHRRGKKDEWKEGGRREAGLRSIINRKSVPGSPHASSDNVVTLGGLGAWELRFGLFLRGWNELVVPASSSSSSMDRMARYPVDIIDSNSRKEAEK